MTTRLRVPSRRGRAATLAAVMLIASVSVSPAAPLAAAPGSAAAETIHRRDTFYSDATYTVQVGLGHAGCEGEYWMSWGVQTAYIRYTFLNPCP
jgi:hypothetical protein